MASAIQQYGAPMLLGGTAGAAVGYGVFKFFEWQIDKQLRTGGAAMITEGEKELRREAMQLINTEVPPRVRAAVDEKLREFGLTPETGRRINRVLSAADSVGLIGLGDWDSATNNWLMVGGAATFMGIIGVFVLAAHADTSNRRR